MSTQVNISVVIPAYNVQSWVGETLRSVISQTYDHDQMEIILIDDGSTDATVDVATSILQRSDIDWKLLQVANGGSSGARNLGWQQAKGEWIQFLDSDDLLHSAKIDYQIQRAIQLPKSVAVVYSCWQRIGESDGKWQLTGPVYSPRIGDDNLLDLLKTENFIATGSQLFRRTWLETVSGYDRRYEPIEDVNLLLRIAMSGGQFQSVPSEEPLFLYRQRVGSLSRRDHSKFLEGCIGNAEAVEDYWRKNNIFTPERSKLLQSIYFQAARYFAAVDRYRFEQLAQQLDILAPNFLPDSPCHLRFTSQILGYRKAEKVATMYRRVKNIFQLKYFRSLNRPRQPSSLAG